MATRRILATEVGEEVVVVSERLRFKPMHESVKGGRTADTSASAAR
jgi:hypothetical protein